MMNLMLKSASTVTKRTGMEEVFNRLKLKRSLINSGASKHCIEEVLASVLYFDRISTRTLRRQLARYLEDLDPAAAQRYKLTRTFQPFPTAMDDPHSLELHPIAMLNLEIEPGSPVLVEYKNRHFVLFARSNSKLSPNQMGIHKTPIEILHLDHERKAALRGQMLPTTKHRVFSETTEFQTGIDSDLILFDN